MERELYQILEEPSGETYRQLIQYLSERAAVISLALVGSGKKSHSARRMLESLKPYLVNVVETREWPGTVLAEGYTGLLHRYHVHPESVSVLTAVADGLYAWTAPRLPEDLCFYLADGTALLTSTAHERESDVKLSSEEYAEMHRRMPGLRLKRVRRH